MAIFDLVFLFSVLGVAVSLVAAAGFGIAGRRATSARILKGLVIYAAGYVVAGLAVSLVKPQQVLSVDEPWCFDDWCLTVQGVSRSPDGTGSVYHVDLRLFSRARRVAQRALGAWVYLIDDHGRRFGPESETARVPLDTLLGPGESVSTSRSFRIPAGVRLVGLVTGHGGPYCGAMSLLIIGSSGCLFHKPPMVRLP